ncbi:hypothetical protein PT974_11703 [Cladobotryum mycophilum]|uniref:Restriction of telomere capping protein 4 n=1 Tax=Cladobotryum mycophilum TaxID=491253 RepID=A0ABR0S6X1_9HYPO
MNSPYQRRVGLSRNQVTTSLLKSIPGKTPTKGSPPQPRAATTKMTPKLREPVADDAPPMSTDEENESSEGETSQRSGKQSPDLGVDSSEDERPARGSIRPTAFKSSNKTNGHPSRQTRVQPERSSSAAQGKKMRNESPVRANKRRRVSDGADDQALSKSPPSTVDHLKDEHGFVKRGNFKVKYQLGKKAQDLDSDEDDDEPDTKAKFKQPPAHSSPRKTSKLVVPGVGIGSSPIKEAKKLKTKHLADPDLEDDDEESILGKKRVLKKPEPVQRSTKGKPNVLVQTKKGKATKKAPKPKPAPPRSPSPEPAKKFVLPLSFSQFPVPKDKGSSVESGDESELSDVPSDFSIPSIHELFEEESNVASCPWCNATVEKRLLREFAKGKRLNVRMQTRFCQSHKKKTALETWKEKKYPEIEWDELEDRFSKHRGFLLGIINGNTSHYRTIMATKIETGQARLMKKEENLNPGYYGPRGFNLMCDYLVGEFGDMLKENAVNDKVISGRGSAAFIQSVLVAELAVQLIKEDMHVSLDSARGIMEESKALGELVHEDI